MAGVYLFGSAIPERWGDIGTAMVTLTVMLTLENFPDSFLGGLAVTPWALLYFLSYMFFIVFTVLNILIGIVITAMDQAREEVTADRAAEGLPTATGTIHMPASARDAHSGHAELDALAADLDAVASSGTASPDHIRRLREEIARLRTG
jgi:voltage-gated sodium channel